MAETRLVTVNGAANQQKDRRDPRSIIIHAHRAAHKNQRGEGIGIFWQQRTFVELEEHPGNRVTIKKAGKIAWAVLFGKTKNGDRFYRFNNF